MDATDAIGQPLTDFRVQRDESEFEYLFLEHYPRVLRLLTRLTGSRAQAEEVSNEVFWRLSRQPRSWLLTSNVGPWLSRTAMNAGIDWVRASGKRVKYEDSAISGTPLSSPEKGPLDALLRQENCRRVQRVLSEMKPARAQVLLLRSSGALYKEVAESMGVSVASVGTLLNRAEEEFRKKYLALMAKENAK